MKKITNMSCWIVGEGLTGTENQCLGVTQALGIAPTVKRIKLRQPWRSFSPFLGLEQWWSFDPIIYRPWPDLVIAAGRKAIAPARYIRRASEGRSFTVFLQDPRIDTDAFDLVAAPMHDQVKGGNVIHTIASPNRITPDILNDAVKDFPALDSLPSPRVAVLIGGNSNTHQMTREVCEALITDLKKLDATLIITASRRTPDDLRALITKELSAPDNHIWDGEGANPYHAYLALADHIIVTSDSASMLSDAASTGKPVYRYDLPYKKGASDKFTRLYQNLEKHGAIRAFPPAFTGKLDTWQYEPLNDAQKVANAIKAALKQRAKDKG